MNGLKHGSSTVKHSSKTGLVVVAFMHCNTLLRYTAIALRGSALALRSQGASFEAVHLTGKGAAFCAQLVAGPQRLPFANIL